MHVEVDQSGKIGQTNVDTVLAFSNGVHFSVLIPRRVKQECARRLRTTGLSAEAIYMRLFATGLYILLKEHIGKVDRVLIDTEYFGKEASIKEHLYNLFRRSNIQVFRHQVVFGYIGKESSAHKVALDTYRRIRSANRILSADEILQEFKLSK
ncbi:MAG: hypothetical protein R3A44_14700 [Caldilineaceae bacterium]